MAFVGAGMSVRAGFSDWSTLLQRLERSPAKKRRKMQHRKPEAAGMSAVTLEDLAWRAEEIRDANPRYLAELAKYFSRRGREDEAIDALARLGFRHIFTTNYDRSLERALRKAGRTVEVINWGTSGASAAVLRSFNEVDDICYLIHLHGRCDQPETIVLSEGDYRRVYVSSDATMRRLFALFSLRRVVFFGASLTDIDVLSVFRQVFAARESSLHFSVMPPPRPDQGSPESMRERYLRKFGISPIYYHPQDKHANLLPVIAALHPEHGRKPRPRAWRFRGGLWSETEAFRHGGGKADEEDFQKGRFGGRPRCNGRVLDAEVTPSGSAGWFDVALRVSPTNGRPLTGTVKFWLHQTFGSRPFTSVVRNGIARLTVAAYGAFTVGAIADGGKTPLELNLAELESAPEKFRAS